MLLEADNLEAVAAEKVILRNCSLSIPRGEIHVIMGPNGSGKSTLCSVLMGHSDYRVTSGTLRFEGEDLLSLPVDERARRGIFLGFQYPREIPGVSLGNVLRAAMEARGKKVAIGELVTSIKRELKRLNLGEEFLTRSLNEHASGGEKKRLEVAQLGVIAPKLAVLDEIDSGLDLDSLKTIAAAIKRFAKEHRTTFLIITHYERLLRYVKPDRVHIMADGAIVTSGGMALVRQLEKEGYKKFAKV